MIFCVMKERCLQNNNYLRGHLLSLTQGCTLISLFSTHFNLNFQNIDDSNVDLLVDKNSDHNQNETSS